MSTPTTLPADKFDTTTAFVRPEPLPTRVPLDRLAVLPGFNTRVKDADYAERVAGIAESIANNGFFDDKPFAVTMLPGDETVYIYDGEHRFDAAKQALLDGADFAGGLPVAWAKDGATVRDLTIHLAHGNNGERLNMVELAAVVRRMQGLDMTKDEIAAALGRTTRHVDNLFVLAAANNTVKKAVASGKIAGAEAVKLLRKDPATAAAKITEAVKKAEEKGKAKATPKTMSAPKGPKTKTVSMALNFPVGKTVGEVLKAMATELREHVEFNKADDVILTDALLRFSVTTVDREAEAAAAAAAEAKAKAAEEKAEAAKKAAAEKAQIAKDKEAEAAKAKKLKAANAELDKVVVRSKAPAKAETPAKGKAPSTAETAPKKARARKAAGSAPETPAEASSAPESGEKPAADLPKDSMGGL